MSDIQQTFKTDIVFSYLNSHRDITDEELSTSPMLKIVQEDGDLFPKHKSEILINARGLMGGGRNVGDGVALFGNSKLFESDIKLDLSSQISAKNYKAYPYIFAIYYKYEDKTYYLRGYTGEGADHRMLFIKLTADNTLILKKKEILSIGNSIIQITPLPANCIEIYILTNSNNDQNNIVTKRIFDKDNITEITIGRDSQCTYAFVNDKSFSRLNTRIVYENDNWIIKDGSPERSSKNGTWVFGLHSFPIKDGMLAEILNSKLRFHITNHK